MQKVIVYFKDGKSIDTNKFDISVVWVISGKHTMQTDLINVEQGWLYMAEYSKPTTRYKAESLADTSITLYFTGDSISFLKVIK